MERDTVSILPPDADVIDRYLSGTINDVEREDISAWIAANPEWGERVDTLGTVLRNTSGRARLASDTSNIWATSILAEEATSRQRPARSRISRRLLRGSIGLTAAVVMMAFGWNYGVEWIKQTTALYGEPSVSVYSTSNGERATVKLPDGSTVVLNVASQLEVPSDYDRGNRTIRLRGEALFTVTHNNSAPFTVVAGTSTTRVLGTSFVVRRYDTDTMAIVAVRDGKVGVGSVILTANQQLTVNDAGTSHLSDARPGQFTFVSGALTLSDVPLNDAIVELNRWYNANIRIANSELSMLGMRGISGVFASESIAELVEMLEFMFNVRVEQRGRILTIHSR